MLLLQGAAAEEYHISILSSPCLRAGAFELSQECFSRITVCSTLSPKLQPRLAMNNGSDSSDRCTQLQPPASCPPAPCCAWACCHLALGCWWHGVNMFGMSKVEWSWKCKRLCPSKGSALRILPVRNLAHLGSPLHGSRTNWHHLEGDMDLGIPTISIRRWERQGQPEELHALQG